ncbi:type IV secretion system protein VirB3 [Roseobacter weihaiensis]|uniref:type IV secretion system protein VirB3 n=1 Tax=Roseobacter weihaiensis TaxID=2763262 RepID=UPI001D09E370|nr:type IV secretion system protein VirB3 [Roseobacter sp. H9]
MAKSAFTDEEIQQDKVFLALTRPAMFKGVPLEAAVLCLMVSGLIMIVLDSMLYFGIIVPLFALCRLIVKKDANAFRVIFRFLETKARCSNRKLWGGSSTSPLRLHRKYSFEDHN